jgi:predicted nucleotidyltransferase component of viral defense system
LSRSDIKDLPASIHARLLNLAHANGRTFNEVMQYYAMERFLYRLAQSKHAKTFVLKGALLFRVWGLPALRPTRDIDLLGHTSNEVGNLVAIVKDICRQKVQEDGIIFDPESVTGQRIKEDADYKGVRLNFTGLLGTARLHLQLDIGFADVVSPAPLKRVYPTILPMPAPELSSYPPETVVAEKLQAMIYLGLINSRMKDYYDLWIIAKQFDFDGLILQESIRRTFENRKTSLPEQEPLAFSRQFADEKQSQWEAFLKTNLIMDVPDQLEIILNLIRQFTLPIFENIRAETKSMKMWKKGMGWE